MPAPPRTWADVDPVTANYLNGDLYKVSDAEFVPNGVRFHARKPVYKSTPNGAVSIPATSWQFAYQGQVSNPMADSCGDYGSHMDPAFWGAIQSVLGSANGSVGTVGGGWYLTMGFTPINAGTSTTIGYGTAHGWSATPDTRHGTNQRGNAAHDNVSFICDLNELGSNTWSLAAWNGDSVAHPLLNAPDGSGKTSRFQALWACSTTGTVVAAPAPKQSWVNTDAWSAAFANGNTGIRDVLRFLNYPPCVHLNGTGSLAISTNTTMTFSSSEIDNYSGWNGTNTWTVPRDGLYLLHALIPYTAGTGHVQCAISINGTLYWGPASVANAGMTSFGATATKTQIFSLSAGDTVQVIGWQNYGSPLLTQTGRNVYLITAWLGAKGIPSPLPNPPDVVYRYLAGYQPDLSTLFNQHLANDLSFLVYRPYLLSYQGTAQTGIAQATWTQVNMDTIGGIVHADGGDNYAGWNSANHNYVAQRPGWYLCVYEPMTALPSLTTQPTNIAGFKVSGSNPANVWDEYQQQCMSVTVGCAGATAIGLYYLRTGDAVTPGVYIADASATTSAMNVSAGRQSHFECVWVSE